MFDSALKINAFQVNLLLKTVGDLDDGSLYERCPGHNHPPVWILGHLAITGEFGQQLLGGDVFHPGWLQLFGPGSSDDPLGLVDGDVRFTISTLTTAIETAYAGLLDLAAKCSDSRRMNEPHGVEIFSGTSIETIGDMITLLLTNHFGFHLAQLSACRRSRGHGPLF